MAAESTRPAGKVEGLSSIAGTYLQPDTWRQSREVIELKSHQELYADHKL